MRYSSLVLLLLLIAIAIVHVLAKGQSKSSKGNFVVKRVPVDTTNNETKSCLPKDKDCFGICFGTAKRDLCGTCNGDNSSCKDCLGVVLGSARKDCKGMCNGGHVLDKKRPQPECCKATDVGCDGICFSEKKLDKCGVCEGTNECIGKTLEHCGPGGSWKYDKCGICNGGDECLDCAGIPWGSAKIDLCGVCAGTNDCLDCEGTPHGNKTVDLCGYCGGDNSKCLGCDGRPGSGLVWDPCGVCGGNGTSCCGQLGSCSNHGECNPELRGCFCDYGWTGPLCQAKANRCSTGDSQCNGKGHCDPNTGGCICQENWSGENCEWFLCSGHGVFDPSSQKCTCFPGYDGIDCSICEAPEPGHAFVCLQVDITHNGQTETNTRYNAGTINKVSRTNPVGNIGAEFVARGSDVNMLTASQRAQLLDTMYGTKQGDKTTARRNMARWDSAQTAIQNQGTDWTQTSTGAADTSLNMLEYQMAPTVSVRFTRLSVPIPQVDSLIAGSNKKLGIAILPGGSHNDFVYGCDCQVATPVGQKVNMTFGSELKDAIEETTKLLIQADKLAASTSNSPSTKSRFHKKNDKKEPIIKPDIERVTKAIGKVPVKKLFVISDNGRKLATQQRLIYTQFKEPAVYQDSRNLPLELSNTQRREIESRRSQAIMVGRMISEPEDNELGLFSRVFPYWFFPILFGLSMLFIVVSLALAYSFRRELGIFQ